MKKIENKVVLVTGGTGGIGLATRGDSHAKRHLYEYYHEKLLNFKNANS